MPKDGHVHVPFEYPSTRVPLEQSAEYLHSVMESLTDVSKISFVVHSMGGLIVRRYLKQHRDTRLHRMVMMGTPNNGAELADMLKGNFLFRTLYGPAGQELVTDSGGAIKSLPTPDFEFGIVAGGKGDASGYNRLLPGDNDGTVTVASAPGSVWLRNSMRYRAWGQTAGASCLPGLAVCRASPRPVLRNYQKSCRGLLLNRLKRSSKSGGYG